MALPSCCAIFMCARLAPALEPQNTQIFARGVPSQVPFVATVPFWPGMGMLDDMVTSWLLFCANMDVLRV